jgi:hypothetical protein
MLGSLLEGRPPTGRPLPQAAAIENVLAFDNIPAPWIRLIQRKCGAIQLDYVNETRGFVMELGFHHGPDHAKLSS